ncbi:MAG: O-antigen ligase family protein [Actinomycetota bacterium]|nr:O-antigen ligase family protein [Actinomycetota bacterium]
MSRFAHASTVGAGRGPPRGYPPADPPTLVILLRRLQAAPATLPVLIAVALFLVGTSQGAGYDSTLWYPAALGILAMLAIAAAVLRPRLGQVPRPVLIAGAFLLAYTAWSFLSIAWADAKGDAWDGANRTLLYLLIFALFALWPQRGGTAAVVLGLWTAGIVVLAAYTVVAVGSAADPQHYFLVNRLRFPADYPNGAAATFLMAAWPALLLAARREVGWWLRGAFAGGAVLLVDAALLAQSRGGVFSVPIVLVLFFLITPQRPRSFAVLIPIGLAVAVTAPTMLDVADRIKADRLAPHAVDQPVLLAAGLVALIVAAGALLEVRMRPSEGLRRATYRAAGALGIAAVVIVAVAALAAVGNPVARANHEWKSFKAGYPATKPGQSRLTQGLGSNRYDFYRVAYDSFSRHPLVGIGADNFGQEYLQRGRSDETPRYPHSLELRTLAQTGVVGALLLVGWLAAALLGALRAVRRGSLGGAVAAGATVTFLYWLVHGSFDWFWEIAGLGAPAVAMLGLACALAPRRSPPASDPAEEEKEEEEEVDEEEPRPRAGRPAIAVLAGAIALGAAAAVSLGAPWLAERAVKQASAGWRANPTRAFDRLDLAATLNPVSDRPSLIAGSIALKLGELKRADRAFAEAASRNPRSDYAYLERGVIASVEGRNAQAVTLLSRAAGLSPHDPFTTSALATARGGRQIDLERLNAGILGRAREITRGASAAPPATAAQPSSGKRRP